MSSAHRSSRERREDAMSSAVRSAAENAAAIAEGKRQQAELINAAEADGTISSERARLYRERFGLCDV